MKAKKLCAFIMLLLALQALVVILFIKPEFAHSVMYLSLHIYTFVGLYGLIKLIDLFKE